MTKKKTGLICVKCGGEATEGSMKHPYCKKHFKEEWNNNNNKYSKFLSTIHT